VLINDRIEGMRTEVQFENPEERDHLEDLGVVGIKILKCILKIWR
jgi:hypothetical protein